MKQLTRLAALLAVFALTCPRTLYASTPTPDLGGQPASFCEEEEGGEEALPLRHDCGDDDCGGDEEE